MKTNKILLGIFAMSLFTTSCNKDWVDEQYEQYVSIKAPMDAEGVTPIYVRYNSDGKYTYRLPLVVSGSTSNANARNVRIIEDQDTLNIMNMARFGEYRKDLYYKALPKDQFYSIPEVVTIPKGESTGICNIDFNLTGIDMNEKWVVPLRVQDDASYDYASNPRKNYAEAILRIHPFNDFSGTYSTATQIIKLADDSGEPIGAPMTVTERTAYVVDDNTIFFYAGLVNEELEDRHKYKFFIDFEGLETETKTDDKIKVTCPNADINFKLTTPDYKLTYSTYVVKDAVKPYLEYHYVTFSIDYTFDDISAAKNPDGTVHPIKYSVSGAMTLERQINTLIPDEDQAIQW